MAKRGTDLPNSDDGVCNQNEKNDKRFDERCYLVFRLFEPRQYLHSEPYILLHNNLRMKPIT